MLNYAKLLTLFTGAALLSACSSPSVSQKGAATDSHVIIGVNKGPTAVLTYSPKTLKFTGQALTENADAHYVRLTGDTLFTLHPNALSASVLDAGNADLSPIATTESGKGPTAVEALPGGSVVFTAHFPDKRLTARGFDGTKFSKPQEFACSEAHQFRPHPSGKFAYAACRADTLRQFKLDAGAGTVTPLEPAIVTVAGGPRHLDFHPSGDTLYLLLEHSSEVAVFNINPDTGAVVQPPKQTIPTTVDGAMNRSSDLHISPNGKHVYAFNRVNQDMAVFDVAPDRTLERTAIVPMGFGEVRDWAMAKDGDYIITASNEGHVGLWSVDSETGVLTLSDARTGLGNAVSAAIVE